MKLTGLQREKIHDALLSAFPSRVELDKLMSFRLDLSPTTFAELSQLSSTIQDLITWAEAHNRLSDLLAGALDQNPDNDLLRAVAEDFKLWSLHSSTTDSAHTADEILSGQRYVFEAQYLVGFPEVYQAAEDICVTVQKRIIAFTYASHPQSPPHFVRSIAQRLKETKAAGNPATFEIVQALDRQRRPANLIAHGEELINIYRAAGVEDLFQVRILDMVPSIGIDVLIVDELHALLSWSPRKVQGHSQFAGMLFQNNPQIAGSLTDWLNKFVFQDKPLIPFAKWIASRRHRK